MSRRKSKADGFILDAPPHGKDIDDPEANQRWLASYLAKPIARAAALRTAALEARQSPIYEAAAGSDTHGPSKRVCYKAKFLRDTGAGRLDPRWLLRGRIIGTAGAHVRVRWEAVELVHPDALTFVDRADADASNCSPLGARGGADD